MSDISEITKSLIQARKNHTWSQKILAQKLQMRQSQISDLEKGKHDIRAGTLIEVARVLGLELILVPRSLLPVVSYFTKQAAYEDKDDDIHNPKEQKPKYQFLLDDEESD